MTGTPVNPEAAEYVYRQVDDHIAAEIAAGKLRPGARLPGGRELAEQYCGGKST
ncbi:GntR family transcriptional regulator [Streptomyces sp. NPDC002596]|uniref:GntR family transcriptional regulator n=1 Tax=Streptomyces sp. NPDC056227 TaxID=3345753 RepID=UPI0035E1640B